MIEFKMKRAANGKRNRWSKRYPRTIINNRGGDKAAHKESNWYAHNWNDDNYSYFNMRHIDKFLRKFIGKNLDDAYSEFLKRISNKNNVYTTSLWSEFKNYVYESKDKAQKHGGYYIDHDNILQYAKKASMIMPDSEMLIAEDKSAANAKSLTQNEFKNIIRKYKESRTIQHIGLKWIVHNEYSKPVLANTYIVKYDKYDSTHYELVEVLGFGYGVSESKIMLANGKNKYGYSPVMERPHIKESDYVFVKSAINNN